MKELAKEICVVIFLGFILSVLAYYAYRIRRDRAEERITGYRKLHVAGLLARSETEKEREKLSYLR